MRKECHSFYKTNTDYSKAKRNITISIEYKLHYTASPICRHLPLLWSQFPLTGWGERKKELLVHRKQADDWNHCSVLNKYLENKVGLMSIMDILKYKLWFYCITQKKPKKQKQKKQKQSLTMLHLLPRNVFTNAQPWHVLKFIHVKCRVLSIRSIYITLTLVKSLYTTTQGPAIQTIKKDKKEI